MFSQDLSGHWVLWNYSTGATIKSGEAPGSYALRQSLLWPSDMAGNTLAIGLGNALELRSSADGHLIGVLVSPAIDAQTNQGIDSTITRSWWKLAEDGSYICAGYSGGLFAWSPTGTLVFSKTGDYSTALVFAAPTQIQIANGPAGTNAIETQPISGTTSTVRPAFQGTFASWFIDGANFTTTQGIAVRVYNAATVQQGSIVALPTIDGFSVSGEGQWVWTIDRGIYYTVSVWCCFQLPTTRPGWQRSASRVSLLISVRV